MTVPCLSCWIHRKRSSQPLLAGRLRLPAPQNLQHIIPVVRPQRRVLSGIMRGGKQNSRTPKLLEVARAVIHQNVGVDDVLVAAENNLAGGNESEILLQPFIL